MSPSGGTNLDTKTATREDDLIAASSTGCDTLVELLLNEGIDVNVKRGLYGNALQAAAQAGHTNTVRILLARGADVNAIGGDNGDRSASCIAVWVC